MGFLEPPLEVDALPMRDVEINKILGRVDEMGVKLMKVSIFLLLLGKLLK